MRELDDIFSPLSQSATASKHSKRKRLEAEGGASKKKSGAVTSSSAVSTDASATHTTSSSKKAKSRTSNEGTSSSTSKKKDVPVVVHDMSKASSMPKQAPRPRDDDDAAFADTRGTERTWQIDLRRQTYRRRLPHIHRRGT